MDAQMKKGMVDVCILSVLARGDSYGYQLIKDIAPLMPLSESTLYPVLRRLEAAGQVSVYAVEHHFRLRKYYAITNAGRQKIADFLEEWAEVKRVYDFIAQGGSKHEAE